MEYTLKTALSFSTQEIPITMALQAYLKRTLDDLNNILEQGINVRLVKGAYKGDLEDFKLIQKRYKESFDFLRNSNTPFFVGTHDPELMEWMKEKASKRIEFVEFGFLKGLADKTKIELACKDWLVSEYVPFGKDSTAYEKRRNRYLKELEKLGRTPAP